jgi:hypothetical protein
LLKNNQGYTLFQFQIQNSPHLQGSLNSGNFELQTAIVLMPDQEIAENIESELFWSPFVDSDRLNVSVEDGKSPLTGTVDFRSEYDRCHPPRNALEGAGGCEQQT